MNDPQMPADLHAMEAAFEEWFGHSTLRLERKNVAREAWLAGAAWNRPYRSPTMPNANGWPDADQPGVPLNPERSGWHYVDNQPCEWWAPGGGRDGRWQVCDVAPRAEWFADYSYGGVCPSSPSELAALLAAARAAGAREERERIVKICSEFGEKWPDEADISDAIAEDIRAAGVPDDSHG